MSGSTVEIDGRTHHLIAPAKLVIDVGLLVVVLLDPDAHIPKFGQFENIVALRRGGEECWRAELPTTTTGDCYLAARLHGDTISARSFSSYDVELDALTGRILSKEFSK